MTVRPATAADVDAIAASEVDNLGADAWSRGWSRRASPAGCRPCTTWSPSRTHRLVGHAVASLAGDIAELQRIAVAADHRRAGVASALLDEVLALAAAGGADRLLLEVREDNADALAFYAARGFVEVDRRRRYYRDGATAVVLRRPLGPRLRCVTLTDPYPSTGLDRA